MTEAKPIDQGSIDSSRARRAKVRALVASGRWRQAETDGPRAAAFDRARKVTAGAEAIVGDTNDLQQVAFLLEGGRVRRAIAYVESNDAREARTGTGFLISDRLFLTNQHVIPDADAAKGTVITFDREMLANGRPSATTSFWLDPDTFALFSDVNALDYALIAVGPRSGGSAELADLGSCPISGSKDRHRIGMNVNIIQHPGGLPKMIAVRNNLLTDRTDRTLLYETDTEQGSSGSPVFNDLWEIIALHHWGSPYLEEKDDEGKAFPAHVNEGVRISAIYDDLVGRRSELSKTGQALLDRALALGREPAPSATGPVLSPPRPEAGGEALVGTPVRMLRRGAEVLSVDRDYTNRTSFDTRFLEPHEVPLPTPSAKLAKQIAPLRGGEANAESGVLAYEHFAVVMNRSKRLAMFTATNIDGPTYLAVDRATGQVGGAEGDKWFIDPRISETFTTGQDFYSEWSSYFDRGHLTRRTDPTWGTEEEAERANADTFHFTNCSPQHFRFNQTTKYWQGVERYVLENGLFANDASKRLVVLQGPIFDSKIDLYADDLQIPSSFFKIVLWNGQGNKLRAVGLVVDQLALLSESRKNLGQPRDVASVDVSQWRVAISTIERRTGLSFGSNVLAADTISQITQPDVGGEAAVRIASFEAFGDLKR